jgi:ribosomal protein S6E (S10)
MPFKINISKDGKTMKIEIESESLIRSKIGDKISGSSVSPDLDGYELEITGTSDLSGFPGIKGEAGGQLKRKVLTRADKGMNDTRKGVRLRKTIRGEEITEKISQINMKVIKEGSRKFDSLVKPSDQTDTAEAPTKPEEKKEEKKEEKAQDTEPKEAPVAEAEKAQPEEEPKSA